MPRTVPIDEAQRNLRDLLSSLAEDERITIVDEAGVPMGEVSASTEKEKEGGELDVWMKEMKEHARRIDEGWIGDKSALQQLREDRSRLEESPDDENGESK
jgi:hypothetical protein